MKGNRPTSLRDWRKRKEKTHTIDSATILPDLTELSDEQLELVIAGMSTQKFEEWRHRILNERW